MSASGIAFALSGLYHHTNIRSMVYNNRSCSYLHNNGLHTRVERLLPAFLVNIGPGGKFIVTPASPRHPTMERHSKGSPLSSLALFGEPDQRNSISTPAALHVAGQAPVLHMSGCFTCAIEAVLNSELTVIIS